jgi:hypothetical protein
MTREMSLRERAAGTGFQIPLESKRAALCWKLDRHDNRPWPMRASVPVGTFVVPVQTLVRVARYADIVLRWI